MVWWSICARIQLITASAQPRLILFEDHVEHPVQAVLDAQWPRTASARRSAVRAAEAPGRGRRARLLDDGLDHADGRQLGEARLGGVAPVTPLNLTSEPW